MRRTEIKLGEKIRGHLVVGREVRGDKHRRQYVLLQCPKCKKETWRRVDNLSRMVGCQCQRDLRFSTPQFIPSKKHYSWKEIVDLSRRYKVGTSNIIHWLKEAGCTYEARHTSEINSELTEKEKEDACLKARIGFSKSQICASLQTSRSALPNDLKIKDAWDRKTLAKACKELRLKGWRISEIAKNMNVSVSTVYRWLNRYYGSHFKKEAEKARNVAQKAAGSKMVGASDHHLSRHYLRKR